MGTLFETTESSGVATGAGVDSPVSSSAPHRHASRRRQWWGALLLIGGILAVLALGWLADVAGEVPPPATNTSGVQTQQAGLYSVTLTLTPLTPHAGTAETMRLRVEDVSGRPLSGATVRYALTMPSMDMAGGAGSARAAGDGVYQLSGAFSTSGAWSLRIGVTPPATNGHPQATVYTTFTIAVQ